jgi:hypothetical protein
VPSDVVRLKVAILSHGLLLIQRAGQAQSAGGPTQTPGPDEGLSAIEIWGSGHERMHRSSVVVEGVTLLTILATREVG